MTVTGLPISVPNDGNEILYLKVESKVDHLDLDSVQLRHLADRTVGDSTDCSRHADCDFFDCRGRCDATTRRCTGGVLNNNLQVVCEKVLLGGEAGGWGLLDSRHASPGLRRVLCLAVVFPEAPAVLVRVLLLRLGYGMWRSAVWAQRLK